MSLVKLSSYYNEMSTFEQKQIMMSEPNENGNRSEATEWKCAKFPKEQINFKRKFQFF